MNSRIVRDDGILKTSALAICGLAAVSVVLIAGCSEPPAAWTDHGRQATAKTDAPLRLDGHGELVSQTLAPGFGPPEFGKSTFDGRCSEPSDYVVAFSITGEATHLGSFVASVEHCGMVDFQTGLGLDRDGRMLFVTANGDQLEAEYEGRALGSGHFEGTALFDGGTGRFASATGQAEFRGQTDRPTATIPVFEMSGSIRYAASDLSR